MPRVFSELFLFFVVVFPQSLENNIESIELAFLVNRTKSQTVSDQSIHNAGNTESLPANVGLIDI